MKTGGNKLFPPVNSQNTIGEECCYSKKCTYAPYWSLK